MLKRSSRRRGRSASIAGLSPIALLPPLSLLSLPRHSYISRVHLAYISSVAPRLLDLLRAASHVFRPRMYFRKCELPEAASFRHKRNLIIYRSDVWKNRRLELLDTPRGGFSLGSILKILDEILYVGYCAM